MKFKSYKKKFSSNSVRKMKKLTKKITRKILNIFDMKVHKKNLFQKIPVMCDEEEEIKHECDGEWVN